MVGSNLQQEADRGERGRIMTMDSAYHVEGSNRDRDVVIAASYCGVLPARFIGQHRPRGAIGVDCGIGPEGAAIAGLWYLEALDIPAAAAAVMTVVLGDGDHVYRHGVVSRTNRQAADCGVLPGMPVRDAAVCLLEKDPRRSDASEVTNREVMSVAESGRQIVCTDSIAFALPEDRDRNVLVTAGHTGRSAVPYLQSGRPHGFICSDGGMGVDGSGAAGLAMVEPLDMAGATVDGARARMGDGHSTYWDGVISACNKWAYEAGVRLGMPAREAALLLVAWERSA
jgi:hypothetical protein